MIDQLAAQLAELFTYPFIIRAMIVGALVSLCAALLGVSIVLKRHSMIGEGLSHVGFGALAIAMALNLAPLRVSLPIVTAAAVLLLRLGNSGWIAGDAAIALISSSALAIGVIVISLSSGMNADICNYMFGSILAMTDSDLALSVAVSLAVLLLYGLLRNKMFAVTFDADFAKASGLRAELYNTLHAVLTALVIVVGMRLMGAMLISSLVIFPALAAMRLFKSYGGVSAFAAIFSALCFFVGIIASFLLALPAGASIVAANLCGFLLMCAIQLARKTLRK